jgi:hypothetical protein
LTGYASRPTSIGRARNMRRWTIAVTSIAVMMVSVCTPAYGATGAPGAVEALKRQLVEHRGVTIHERVTMRDTCCKTRYVYLYKSLVEFGKGEVIATDTRYRAGNRYSGGRDFEYFTFPGQQYMHNENQHLPDGKSWVLEEGKQFTPVAHRPIDAANPAILRAVLATTKVKHPAGIYDGTRTTLYEGTTTWRQLYKAAPVGSMIKPKDPKGKVSWKIWLGRDRLARRVWSTWRSRPLGSDLGERTETHVTSALFSEWGAKTQISRPPAEEVISSEELHDD